MLSQDFEPIILHSAFCIKKLQRRFFRMLYYVSGTVAVLEPGLAVIDCNGVGYGCRDT